MRIAVFVFALVLGGAAYFGASSCGGGCKLTSECDEGQHCNFSTGECVTGCASDGDCAANTRCDTDRGVCVLKDLNLPRRDASTSSTADAASDATTDVDADGDAGELADSGSGDS